MLDRVRRRAPYYVERSQIIREGLVLQFDSPASLDESIGLYEELQ